MGRSLRIGVASPELLILSSATPPLAAPEVGLTEVLRFRLLPRSQRSELAFADLYNLCVGHLPGTVVWGGYTEHCDLGWGCLDCNFHWGQLCWYLRSWSASAPSGLYTRIARYFDMELRSTSSTQLTDRGRSLWVGVVSPKFWIVASATPPFAAPGISIAEVLEFRLLPRSLRSELALPISSTSVMATLRVLLVGVTVLNTVILATAGFNSNLHWGQLCWSLRSRTANAPSGLYTRTARCSSLQLRSTPVSQLTLLKFGTQVAHFLDLLLRSTPTP